MLFRKKPVVVEAMHYAGGGNFHDSDGALPEWLWEALESETITTSGGRDPIYINTLEGRMEVRVDDLDHPWRSGRVVPVQARHLRGHLRGGGVTPSYVHWIALGVIVLVVGCVVEIVGSTWLRWLGL